MLVCQNCEGSNIEVRAWIDPNTNKVVDLCSDGEDDDNWCRDCDEHVYFTEIEMK